MRTENKNGITISYPDEIGFAFMPCVVKAKGEGITVLETVINGTEQTFTYRIDAFGDYAILDYREYIQAMFSGYLGAKLDYSINSAKNPLLQAVSVSVCVYDAQGSKLADLEYTTNYVWGAIQTGETWNGYKRLTWFRNYPFSFGLFVDSATSLLIDGKKYDMVSSGIWDITSKTFGSRPVHTVNSFNGEIKQATFDLTFDLTFYLGSDLNQKRVFVIDTDDSDEGIFLRWIDRHGFYRYWLFVTGEESRAVTSSGEFMRNNLEEWDDELFCYLGSNGRRQGYGRTDTIPICATLVDSDTFDFLQDLTTSPVVDMYLGGDWLQGQDRWQSVTVKAGTYTKSRDTLQDFVANIILQEHKIQSL